VPAENYPFCTIDPSVGVVAVPDGRLLELSRLSNSAKTIPAIVQFVDIAGLVKGASEGEGLGNKFLSHIREVDAIVEVVRIFEDDKIVHVHGGVDPVSDIEVINLELIMADKDSLEKRLANVAKDAKRGDKSALLEESVIKKALAALVKGELLSNADFNADENLILKNFHLLTAKPIYYCLNAKHGSKNIDNLDDGRWNALMDFFEKYKSEFVITDAAIEDELKNMDEKERLAFKMDMGVTISGLDELIKKGYKTLQLETFFTTGEDETRAWTIKRGATAPEAGAAIHTDFRDKFIRADVISCNDLLNAGSWTAAKTKGLVRSEGRDYIVEDGDVIEFKHSS